MLNIALGDLIISYNVGYAIGELSFRSMLIGMVGTGVAIILTFTVLEVYKSYFFSGFPYM